MKHFEDHRELAKVVAGASVYLAAILYHGSSVFSYLLYGAALLITGGEVMLKAWRNLIHGKLLDENFLMSFATIGAFAIGDCREGVAVMLFYQVGELFEDYAVDQSKKSISELMDIRPDFAWTRRGGELVKAKPEEVHIGDEITVRPGEKVPLDAVILDGVSMLDTAALTGESVPREVGPGADLLSGCINGSGLLTARVTKEYGESTVSKILDLVENAGSRKSASENFITRFSHWYTPAVVGTAVLLAAIPPLVLHAAFSEWLYRALIFLVISCPCALVISIPLSFFGGIGGASKRGILVKGGNYLEALSKTKTVVFDKTGTLTKGVFRVQKIVPSGISEDALLKITAYAESASSHPISLSLKQAFGQEIDSSQLQRVEEIPGCGVLAEIAGKTVAVGNAKMMRKINISLPETVDAAGTVVFTAVDGVYRGYILIADELKEDAPEAIRALKSSGITKTVMLTGDSREAANAAASKLEIDEVYSGLLSAGKVEKVEALLRTLPPKGKLAFVGDGINDAPVLARADIGIAMGGLGSDAAIEAADIVIMNDEPSKIAEAIEISVKTLRIVRENIAFALSVKAVILVLGALGIATMWAAVFADVGVTILAVLNAIRMLRVGKRKTAASDKLPPDPENA